MTQAPSETKYEFEPFEQIFLRRREQILQLVGVTQYALRSMEGAARLSQVLKHAPDVVQHVREIETLAVAEAKADLPLLHSAATVLIWGALEAAFRDFLVRWLLVHPSALVVSELKNVRVRVAEYESLDGEERMRYLVGVLERELGASLKPGAGRFECLLSPFGLAPRVSDSDRRSLNELAAVRNVIVHRAGVADARLVQLVPWLALKVGDAVTVGRKSFEEYVKASSNYAAAIIEAAGGASEASSRVPTAQQPVAADGDG